MVRKISFVILLLIVLVFIFVKHFYPNQDKRNIDKENLSNIGLQQLKDLPLSGGTSRLDYQSINYENNRLYISHLGANKVIVFDLKNQKLLKDIALNSSPYGILVVPQLHTVYVGVGGNNQVAVIDENTLKVTKYIEAGDTPDGLAYDPITNKVFVSDENGGTVTVIDASKNERIEDISIGGSVGNTHYDPVSQHIFSVSGQENTLIETKPATNKIIMKYHTTGCSHPHGFYIDDMPHYAAITCQGNNKIIVFDLDKKKIIFTDTVGVDPDVLAYDPGTNCLYVAAESGDLTMFDIQKNKITKLGQTFIADKAHTVSVDKRTHMVYFPLENVDGKPVLRVMLQKH